MLAALWSQRDMIRQLAARDLAARYRSSHLGFVWALLTPLIQLAIYTFVFAVVLKARWNAAQPESRAEFALTMYCGLLLYNLFAETVSRAPTLIVGNANLVKKVVFPLETLPTATLLASLLNMLAGLAVWLAGWMIIKQSLPPVTLLLLPLVLLPLLVLSLGAGWVLSSLGVFLRDIAQGVQPVLQVLFFATPIFYPIDAVPIESGRMVLRLNPLTHIVEDARRVCMYGQSPEWAPWAATLGGSLLLAVAAYAFFMKSKRAFADVL